MAIVNERGEKARRPARIAIVGGGPGGLFTAWHIERLAAAPVVITILEASSRLGGKVVSPTFAAAPVRYEAGAAELYDYSPVGDDPLRQLVQSLGLPTVPLTGACVCLAGRRIANLDDAQAELGSDCRRALVEFDAWARGAMSPGEFYVSGSDLAVASDATPLAATLAGLQEPAVRRYLETMIHSDLATEPAATTTGYGLQNYLMNDPAYMRLYRIAGGNEQLITAIAERLAAVVRLDATVTEITPAANGRLAVAWHTGGRPLCEEFEIVILALPIPPLAAIAFADATLAEAIGRHIAHHNHPAHYLRITLLLDRPVAGVPGEDDYLMLDAFGGACLYVESSRDPLGRHGVLGWLLGGNAAAEWANASEEDLVAAALDSLPEPLAPCRGQVLEARVHRWTGAVSAVPGGWHPLPADRRHRPSAVHSNLLVVGDYLYDSTLNGVFDSAENVAGWVAAELTATQSPPRGTL